MEEQLFIASFENLTTMATKRASATKAHKASDINTESNVQTLEGQDVTPQDHDGDIASPEAIAQLLNGGAKEMQSNGVKTRPSFPAPADDKEGKPMAERFEYSIGGPICLATIVPSAQGDVIGFAPAFCQVRLNGEEPQFGVKTTSTRRDNFTGAETEESTWTNFNLSDDALENFLEITNSREALAYFQGMVSGYFLGNLLANSHMSSSKFLEDVGLTVIPKPTYNNGPKKGGRIQR